jgi:hypothetical protein
MFFETNFDLKQLKLQLKLVSALSDTKRLFRFYTESESFEVSIEPKQTEEQPKQFDREHILIFLKENLGFSGLFWFVSKNSLFRLFRFPTETEFFQYFD